MEEVPGGRRAGGERARRWWLSKLLWKPETQEVLLPLVGSTVGGYHLEAKLGRGGQGTVYRARRGGRLYAVKFLYLPVAGSRARTEVEVLPRLERVGVVKLEGHGKWPDASPLFLFIAMEYVRGRPLYTWAREKAPTARQVARVLLELARQVAAVHAQQVLHRDVKGANVLVVPESGEPVLVDFGVSTWRGAPRRTVGMPPGSWYYRAPEVWRFMRERRPGTVTRYEASGGDDWWALGVVLYHLLTGTYPFEAEDELAFQDAVLTQSPEPPHVRNPRVPRALGESCLRLLEKEPGARLPNAEALESALKQALETADAAWDVPLYPQAMAPSPEESPTLQPPTREAPPEEDEAAGAGLEDTPAPQRRAWPRWATWVLAGLALLLAAGALLAVIQRPPPPAPSEPLRSATVHPAQGPGASGQEVAPVGGGPEGAERAAPQAAATPAPVARATPPKDTRMKTPHQAPSTQQAKYQEQHKPVPGGTAGTCVMLWAVGQLACTGPAAQVRPLTPSDCPPEAQQAMKEWWLSDTETAHFPALEVGDVTVRRGYGASLTLLRDWGRMPGGSVLTGELVFGPERVYGRFTEARTPEGKWFPVCVQILDTYDRKLGVQIERRSGSDTAVVLSNVKVQAVRE